MSMTMTGGKWLEFEDPMGLDSNVVYTDQNGNEAQLDMRKYCELGKKSKEKEYFLIHINWIEKNELTIGAFIITGMDKLAHEFPEEVKEIMK